MKPEQNNMICSFCKRHKNQVRKLIAGRNQAGAINFICDFCTEICYNALQKNNIKQPDKAQPILTPREIYDRLCEVVEAQDRAKKVLSTVMYNHYKRIYNQDSSIEIEKSNVLLLGPTGTGKTYLIKELAKIMDIPCAFIDATSITAAGYVGADADQGIIELLQQTGGNVQRAQEGIIFIDEIDKIKKSEGSNGQKDVGGSSAQQALLTMLTNQDVTVYVNDKHGEGKKKYTVNTKNILFIVSGAFPELSKIVEKDMSHKLGGHALTSYHEHKYEEVMKHLNSDHLIKYGFIPEFVNRLQIVVYMDELTEYDLERILTIPKNAILKQYEKLLNLKDGAELVWTEEAVKAIAKMAKKEKTCARGLKKIVDLILMPAMFRIADYSPGVKVRITEYEVQNKLPAILEKNGMIIAN